MHRCFLSLQDLHLTQVPKAALLPCLYGVTLQALGQMPYIPILVFLTGAIHHHFWLLLVLPAKLLDLTVPDSMK